MTLFGFCISFFPGLIVGCFLGAIIYSCALSRAIQLDEKMFYDLKYDVLKKTGHDDG